MKIIIEDKAVKSVRRFYKNVAKKYKYSYSLFLNCECKGTTRISLPQEGTFWWDSYQKVGIVMLSDFCESGVNLD